MPLKIAFDFNGVLDTHPVTYGELIGILKKAGNTVGLCTGNKRSAFPKDFLDQFDFIIICDGPEEELRLAGKIATTHEEKMKWWKSAALKEHKVDVIFDDFADVIEGTLAIKV